MTNRGLGFGLLAFQRRKRAALCLNVFAVRPSIGRALANDALGEFVGALGMVGAKSDTVVMAEVKFREIAMQILLGEILVGPAHAALEN